jgi:hypothetical protein
VNSFVAFIDEAGDEGFVFRPHPQQGSSQWFTLAACIMREKNRSAVMRKAKELLGPLEAMRKAPVHFMQLPHEQRVSVAHMLGTLSMRIVAVTVDKIATSQLEDGHTLIGRRRLYFYYTRYVLERLSWITRDSRRQHEGDGFCKLIFSRAKSLSYDALKEYLDRLRRDNTVRIDWSAIDTGKIEVLVHEDSLGLRLADSVASGVQCAFELSRHGFCEDRYLRLMKEKFYRYNGRCLSYGLKINPQIPVADPQRDNRYGCLDWFDE